MLFIYNTSGVIHVMLGEVTKFECKKVYITKILNQFKYITIIYTCFI